MLILSPFNTWHRVQFDEKRIILFAEPVGALKWLKQVWIYGGSFYSGSFTLDLYDPRLLASEQEVTLITVFFVISNLKITMIFVTFFFIWSGCGSWTQLQSCKSWLSLSRGRGSWWQCWPSWSGTILLFFILMIFNQHFLSYLSVGICYILMMIMASNELISMCWPSGYFWSLW